VEHLSKNDQLEQVLKAMVVATRDLKEAYDILFSCADKLYFHGEPKWSKAANECAARNQDNVERLQEAIGTVISLQLWVRGQNGTPAT